MDLDITWSCLAPNFFYHEILQRNYWKMTILYLTKLLLENDFTLLSIYWKMTMSFSNNSLVKLSHYNIIDL